VANDNPIQIPLADGIRALRRELVAAVAEGEGEQVRFALGPVELELQVEMARERGGEGGIKFWVVSLGGKGSRSSGATHTVRLSLTPTLAADADRDVPLIVGSQQVQRPR
jgi:Trypsin-co-occurring domain 2